ncbi:hypothetical protein NP493_6044g00000 [Ridgeia piscesae]|uniref:Uncharacterized protein n=1 Tax=Ridgeia piscesae TaxID=27915 RepID=A0AAD9IS57_RIDPI|nr:hypothetical protein NP493_6044g00000 [Ridgeia piscesae]
MRHLCRLPSPVASSTYCFPSILVCCASCHDGQGVTYSTVLSWCVCMYVCVCVLCVSVFVCARDNVCDIRANDAYAF